MKVKYQYIHFVKAEKNKKEHWEVYNNRTGSLLAYIIWYPSWKQWVTTQAQEQIIFSDSCFLDIIDFKKQLEPPK
jgi:hypothetical protein